MLPAIFGVGKLWFVYGLVWFVLIVCDYLRLMVALRALSCCLFWCLLGLLVICCLCVFDLMLFRLFVYWLLLCLCLVIEYMIVVVWLLLFAVVGVLVD